MESDVIIKVNIWQKDIQSGYMHIAVATFLKEPWFGHPGCEGHEYTSYLS